MTLSLPSTQIANAFGVSFEYVNTRAVQADVLPPVIGVIGQAVDGNTAPIEPYVARSSAEVGDRFGFGSPLHLAARMLYPDNRDGVGSLQTIFYPVAPAAGATAATTTISFSGNALQNRSYSLILGGIVTGTFTVTTTSTPLQIATAVNDLINATVNAPVTSTLGTTDGEIDIASKWFGTSANDIIIQLVGELDAGLVFANPAVSGGAGVPSIQPALQDSADADPWVTLFVNCFSPTDSAITAQFDEFLDPRWNADRHTPAVAVTGTGESVLNTAIVVPEANRSHRTNLHLAVPGSPTLPAMIAARTVARVAVVAATSPSKDYTGLALTGVIAGARSDRWDGTQRNEAVTAGLSTTRAVNNVVVISDLVTFYHPANADRLAYSRLVTITKLQNALFAITNKFAEPQFQGAAIISDGLLGVVDPTARRPKDFVTALQNVISGLASRALLGESEQALASARATIDEQNPNRVNLYALVNVSGNSNVINAPLQYGFIFGGGV